MFLVRFLVQGCLFFSSSMNLVNSDLGVNSQMSIKKIKQLFCGGKTKEIKWNINHSYALPMIITVRKCIFVTISFMMSSILVQILYVLLWNNQLVTSSTSLGFYVEAVVKRPRTNASDFWKCQARYWVNCILRFKKKMNQIN